MAQAIPYLAFNGTCAEAMRFYERVLAPLRSSARR